MIVAGSRIVATGVAYAGKAWSPTSSPLEIRALADGRLLHAEVLPGVVVDHGLAAADGRRFLRLEDGTVVCLE